ncbi:Capsid [Wuhan pillworm virus 3]|uniref:Capsid n=1 Tax=Wuhan pillworm virus 3 TaxID=1923746 RepID=UPI00090B5CF9|nr:Capsid [Wuhan pillworm virus 3]APG75928.1 Capsid [Wuhan pillworm virus 3]
MNAQTKKITCHACGRRFNTQQALHQHQQAVHGAANQRVPRGAGRGGRGRRNGQNNQGPARQGTAQSVTSRATPNQGVSVSGFERLGSIDIVNAASASWQVNAWMTPRLQAMSSAFQRIHYLSLKVNVVAFGSAIGTGGYVIGFVADPSDATPTISQLQSQAGARTCKSWENCDVPLVVPGTLYYTSRDNEPRWYSPGRIVILVDGIASAGGKLVINLHWSVRLSVPTATPPTVLKDIFLSEHLYVIPGKNILGWKDGTTFRGNISKFLSTPVPGDSWLSVPTFGIEYNEGVGDTGTILIHYLKYNSSEGSLTCSNDGEKVVTQVWQASVAAQVVVPRNTILTIVDYNKPAKPAVSDFIQPLVSNFNNVGIDSSRNSTTPSAGETGTDPPYSTYLELLRRQSALDSKISRIELQLSKMVKVLMPKDQDSSQSSRSRSPSKDTTKLDSKGT